MSGCWMTICFPSSFFNHYNVHGHHFQISLIKMNLPGEIIADFEMHGVLGVIVIMVVLVVVGQSIQGTVGGVKTVVGQKSIFKNSS